MRIAITCILLCTLADPIWAAQGKGKGKPDKSNAQAESIPAGVVDVRFGSSDVRIISDYYRSRLSQLPPGLQKKVQRGGTLPPGWQKKVQAFPVELERQLPVVAVGYHRVISGPVAMLIHDATNVVLDIIELTR